MGGSITVKSKLHQGSCFYFNIPVEIEQNNIRKNNISGKIVRLEDGVRPPKILIVEDTWENRKVLSHLLESVGYSIREAKDGQEGFDVWTQFEPDLILMDIQMPVWNGLKTTQMIRGQTHLKQPIIIALSASTLDNHRSDALVAGCDEFIGKPFQEQPLLEAIARHLNVNYTIEMFSEPPQIQDSTPTQIQPDSLQALDSDWLYELNLAAKQLNSDRIHELLHQLQSEHESIQMNLSTLVHNFDFDKIVDLTQSHCHAVA